MIALFKTLLKVIASLAFAPVLVSCVQMYHHDGQVLLPVVHQNSLRVATYNVHYISAWQETGNWSLADWERRKEPLDQAFKFIDADVVAFQEMESFSGPGAFHDNLALDFLLQNNPDYGAAASGNPDVFPNTQPIFYRTNRLAMTNQGWFFFSETPDVIYSRTFNGSVPAFANWASFTDRKTGAEFRVVNIHTDYASGSNRLKSVALVAERIRPWISAGENVFVMGDLNAQLGAPTLNIIEETGVTFAPVKGATFHFNRGLDLYGAIDHIGWVGNVRMVSEPMVVRRKFSGEWPSDHYPYVIDFTVN